MHPICRRARPGKLHQALPGLQRVAFGDEQFLTAQQQGTPGQALQCKRLPGETRGAKVKLRRTITRPPGPIGLYRVLSVHFCLSALYRQA